MGFDKSIGDEASKALDEMAQALTRPRDVMLAVAETTGWHFTLESHAAGDFGQVLFAEGVNLRVLQMPRMLASLFLRFGADHLAGLGALFKEREVWASPGALARAALEHGVRAFWVLDPKTSTRERCARAVLEELASAYFSKQSVSNLGGKSTDAYRTTSARLKDTQDLARAAFKDVALNDDPFRWTIEDQRFLRITEVVEHWGDRRLDKIPGRGIYDALSLYPHPQGLAGREEVTFVDDGVKNRLSTDVAHLARQANAGFAAWYDGMMVLVTYHGFPVELLDELHDVATILERHGRRT